MKDMVTVEVEPEVWLRMTRKEAERLGYPFQAEGTKKATPTRKKATSKKAAADG